MDGGIAVVQHSVIHGSGYLTGGGYPHGRHEADGQTRSRPSIPWTPEGLRKQTSGQRLAYNRCVYWFHLNDYNPSNEALWCPSREASPSDP